MVFLDVNTQSSYVIYKLIICHYRLDRDENVKGHAFSGSRTLHLGWHFVCVKAARLPSNHRLGKETRVGALDYQQNYSDS
jgi:hypothetical protein